MKINLQCSVFRIRTFLIALFALLVCVAILSAVSAHFLHIQWQQTAEELRFVNDHTTQTFGEMEKVFMVTINAHRRVDRPISIEEIRSLSTIASHYEKFLERTADNKNLRPTRARSLVLVGQFYCELGVVKQAVKAYRKARGIYLELIEVDKRLEYRFSLAETNNYLSHLLTEMGQTGEARSLSRDAMNLLAKLAEEMPSEPLCRLELAIAYNNYGLLALQAGEVNEARDYLYRYTILLEQIANELPDDSGSVERLLDGQQVLAGFLCSAHCFDEAQKICAGSIALLQDFEQKRRETATSTLDLQTAQMMMQANQKHLEKVRAASAQSTKNDDSVRFRWDWNWRPLFPRDEKTIQPDILIRGTLPGEFEPQDALLLSFRWRDGRWCQKTLTEIVSAAWPHIQITIVVPDAVAQQELQEKFTEVGVPAGKIHFYQIPTDSVWIRDYGPLVIKTGAGDFRWVDAMYDPNRFHDDHVPTSLARLLGATNVRVPLYFNGGNLLSNSKGLCVATETLLEKNAALGYTKEHVTATIKRLFAAKEVVYLEPLKGEPTGDVDWFVTFTSPDTVVVGDYGKRDPVNAAILDRNAARLGKVQTPSGPLKVVRIPMPPRGDDFFGGSYNNVLFANKVLLVPTWPEVSPEMEKEALDTYRKLLPGWKVVGISIGRLRQSSGAFRCMTMQVYRIPGTIARLENGKSDNTARPVMSIDNKRN